MQKAIHREVSLLLSLRKWVMLLAIMTLIIMSLMTGVVWATPTTGGSPPMKGQSLSADGDTAVLAPGAEGAVGEETSADDPAAVGGEVPTDDSATKDEVVVETPGSEALAAQAVSIDGSDDATTDPGKADPKAPQNNAAQTSPGQPGMETQGKPVVPDPTSLKISKGVDEFDPPGTQLSLTKTVSEPSVTMDVGTTYDVKFTITAEATATSSFNLEGHVDIVNDPTWPAHVTAITDTVEYRVGNDWYPAPLTFTSATWPGAFPFDIAAGANIRYYYEGTFTIPGSVDLSTVKALRNTIYITISNHPDGVHVFHSTYSFYDKDTDGPLSTATVGKKSLQDIESITPGTGLGYSVISVTIDGNSTTNLTGPWELDFAAKSKYVVEITKRLSATLSGVYLLHNTAKLDGLEAAADVTITVPGSGRLGLICGFKFLDKNANGVMDPGEPGIPNVTIKLFNGQQTVTAITDQDGYYSFPDLPPGNYTVWVDETTAPAHTIPTTFPIPTLVSLQVGQVVAANFGNAPLASICGFKFMDSNGNGIMDSGELGIPMVRIGLEISLDNNVDTDAINGAKIIIYTLTDINGHFCFQDLLPGTYRVFVDETTAPQGTYPSSFTSTQLAVGWGDHESVNFANAPYGSISGTKWNDLNGNGADDPGEKGVSGVTITLTGTTSGGVTVQDSRTTDSKGEYSFLNLEAGTYTLTETVPGGMQATSPASKQVTLKPGENKTVDFHNMALVAGETVTPTPTPTPTPTTTEVQGEQALPATGMNQLPMILGAGLLVLLGLIALALGILRLRRAPST